MFPLDRSLALAAGLAVFGLVLPGCGPKYPETIPVAGTVTLDGRPVSGAAVVFTPEAGEAATATTDASGRFSLSTFRLGDGALPGDYRVTVSKTTVEPGEEEKVVFVVPKEYGNVATSPLACQVQKEMGPVELNLHSTPAAVPPAIPQDAPAEAEAIPPAAEAAPVP